MIVVGLPASTCIDSTARYSMELGHHVTPVRDATAAFSHKLMHADHELIAALPKISRSEEARA